MKNLSEYLQYEFDDINILKIALTHPSIYTNKGQLLTYEKLEFLGDTVLSLIVTEFLINEYQKESEGSLANRRAALVSRPVIAEIARKINLGSYMEMTEGEESGGGRINESNLENCMEALIGAIYYDGGLFPAKEFVLHYWLPIAKSMVSSPKDSKTALQELAQKSGKPIPEYNVVGITGPAHLPEFTVSVTIENIGEATAIGTSKKLAEQKAATILIEKLEHDGTK